MHTQSEYKYAPQWMCSQQKILVLFAGNMGSSFITVLAIVFVAAFFNICYAQVRHKNSIYGNSNIFE